MTKALKNHVTVAKCLIKVKKNTANTVYDQSCSASDPKRSWSVKIDQIDNVIVKQTLAGFSLGFVCKCVSAKNVGSSLYLDL